MKMLKKIIHAREMGSVCFLVILFLFVGCINPAFLKVDSLLQCLNDSVVFTLLACGIALVILTGEIDVSVGAVLGLNATVAATLLRGGHSLITVIITTVLIGVLVGVFNGWGVSALRIPSLIFTLGVNGLIRGLIYVYTGGAWVENLPQWFKTASGVRILGNLTYFYFGATLLIIGFQFLLSKTRRGRYFTAIGDNAQGAMLVGIPLVKIKLFAYIFCSLLASFAGLLYASRIGFVTPVAGNGYEMKAIAACVIGGIALSGGQGSLIGASVGAVIMSSISRILVFMGFSSDYDNAITGIMLIVIVVVTTVLQNKTIIDNRHRVLQARTQSISCGKGQAHEK